MAENNSQNEKKARNWGHRYSQYIYSNSVILTLLDE